MNQTCKKLKIIFTQRWSLGGGLIATHNFCNYLTDLGHEVFCVFIKSKEGKTSEPPHFKDRKYNAFWIETGFFSQYFALARFFKKKIKEEKIDVLISTGGESFLLSLFSTKKNFLHIAFHYGSNFIKKKDLLLNIKDIFLKPGRWIWRLDYCLEREILKRADFVYCVSNTQKKMISKEWKISEKKMRVVYPGVDVKKFSLSNFEEKRIIYCGGLLPNKGINILFSALPLIIKKHANLVVDILGDGNWQEYKRKARVLGIDKNIVYHGHVEHDKISHYFQKAYLLVAPTKHESFGLALIEAMASGLPVVSTFETVVPEVVQDKITGFLVPWADHKKLAEAIIFLLDSPEIAKKMGRAGRMQVEEKFRWENSTKNLEKTIYENLKLYCK